MDGRLSSFQNIRIADFRARCQEGMSFPFTHLNVLMFSIGIDIDDLLTLPGMLVLGRPSASHENQQSGRGIVL